MDQLYKIANDNKISIDYMKMNALESLSVPGAVAIDKSKMKNRADLKTHLSHELGHCMTGSFYRADSKFDLRAKHEYKADRWAITELIPFDKLVNVLKNGETELWQIAEEFEVTYEFAQKAAAYYEEKLLSLKYHINPQSV